MDGTRERNASLIRSYRSSFNRGKSRLAAIIDRAFFAALASLAAFFVTSGLGAGDKAALFVALDACAVYLIIAGRINKIRLKTHIEKSRRRMRSKLFEEKLLLAPDAQLESLRAGVQRELGCEKVEIIRRVAPLTEDDILDRVRNIRAFEPSSTELTVVSLSEPTHRAAEFASQLRCPRVKLISAQNVDTLVQVFPVTENEIDAALISDVEHRPRRSALISSELLAGSAAKYAALGAALTALSFFIGYSAYVRAFGILCLGLALRIRTAERFKLLRKGSNI